MKNLEICTDIEIVLELLDITSADLANNIGITPITISRWRRNEEQATFSNLNSFYNFVFNKNIRLNEIKAQFSKEECPTNSVVLFHGAKTNIEGEISLDKSKETNDFGKGFYLTPLRIQAEKYGERFLRRGIKAMLNIFSLDDERENCTYKVFNSYDGEWLDFVMACRKGLPHVTFDIIEGGIADDQVFNTVDLYFSGIYTREQALNQLQYTKPNRQICITSQYVLDKYLHFQSSKQL